MNLLFRPEPQSSRIGLGSPIFVLFLLITFPLLISPDLPASASDQTENPVLEQSLRLSLGGGGESFFYGETEPDSTSIMELTGELANVNLSVRFPLPVDLFWQNYSFSRIESSYSTGTLDYDGETWDGEPYTTTTQEEIYRFKGYLGSAYSAEQGVLEPYGGVRARQWRDEIMGPGGYRRRITQVFLLGGASFRVNPEPYLSLGIGGEYSSLTSGSVKSYLSDVDPDYNDPTVNQNQGYGIEGYLRTWVELAGLTFRIEAYGRYLDVGSSDTAPLSPGSFRQVYEPKNETTIYGINLSWVWGS